MPIPFLAISWCASFRSTDWTAINHHETVDLFPFTSDADADLVVPFHNALFGELHPRRPHIPIADFRARLNEPDTENEFYGIIDDHGGLSALGIAARSVDGTNADLIFLHVFVRRDMRRQGLGRALLRRAVVGADEHGRTMLMVDVADTVPAGEMFSDAAGADLGIEEHINSVAVDALDLTMLERWLDEGPQRAPDYEILSWMDGYPLEHDAQIARLFVMADEDMPFDDAEYEPQAQTADTVRERLERSDGVIERVASVARHVATGRLVGFSEIVSVLKDTPTLNTTLTVVDRKHRGSAIGKWIKADSILRAIKRYPNATHIQTVNAFSNAPMLGINKTIGFEPEYTLKTYQATTDTVRAYLDGE